jgi:poly-gamma-glutamate synthesis protein (capsule biosynthesis protein)
VKQPSRIWLGAIVGVLVLATAAVAVARLRSTGGSASAEPATPTPAPQPSVRATPASPAPETGPKGTLVIHGAGDVSVDPSWVTSFRSKGYDWAFSGLNGLFVHDDLTVVNLECPATNKGSIIPKEFNFACDPAALPVLEKDGLEVANQANNHAYDYGPQGLLDSLKNIKQAGLASVGAGADDTAANKPAIFHAKGWTIAVVGWDAVVDPYPAAVAAPGHPGTADGHDFQAAVDEVRQAAKVSDLVVLDVHWGVELDTQPEAYQIPQAHKLIDAGADIIFGGHSHRLQPLEMYKGRPIFYSLGNFVWPNLSPESSVTAIAQVTVSPEGKFKAKMLPAQIVSDGHPVLTGHK